MSEQAPALRRPEHEAVAKVLSWLDAEHLSTCLFLFCGGTRLVLEFDEYRVSRGVDFMCSDADGYADLRARVRRDGAQALFLADHAGEVVLPREARTDQYGIRFPVVVGGRTLKVELLREARLLLGRGTRPTWSPVDCMSLDDCCAEKLLANSDRWADRSMLSRDLIDLGVWRARVGPIPAAVWQRVRRAYRDVVVRDLGKAIDAFDADPAHRRRCLEGMQVVRESEILTALGTLRRELPPVE